MVLGDGGIIAQAELAAQMQENSTAAEEEETIETTTSYCSTSAVSYYADVDGDGTVDGIIFADLAVGGSGTWNDDSWSSYSYDAVDSSSLKEYTISETTYTDDNFGEGYIITPASGTTGEDRFYVMALENVDSSYHYWYYNAYGSLPSSKIVSYSTNDFGEGQSNTEFWLEAYANETYGSAYTSGSYTELWSLTGVVGTNVGTSDSIWFIPSKSEWSAFGDVFEITGDNYSEFGLYGWYWSSSVYSSYYAYYAYFSYGYIGYNYVNDSNYVRVCTTF